jgi:imidazolonepropionase-like amidohydrolase
MSAWHLRGTLLPDGEERDLWIDDGRMWFTPVEGAVTVATDVVVLPGLVDVHAHLSLFSPAGEAAPPAERVRASAEAHRDAGVLAIREPGSPDHASVGLGPHAGLPRVVTAGRFLAPPGRYFPGLAREVNDEDLLHAALEELTSSGGAWVKLIGDSPFPGPGLSPTYGADVVPAVVEAVHAAGGRVAVHCALPEVIQLMLEAGVDSLEHATFLREDQVEVLASSGAAWVPTCSINEQIRAMLPPGMAGLVDGQAPAICRAVEAGVTVLAGTDAGMVPHGQVRHEIQLLRDAGLDPQTALAAGSWAAREFLGLPGLLDGGPADFTAYHADPRDDLAVLGEPTLVVLAGQMVKGPAGA